MTKGKIIGFTLLVLSLVGGGIAAFIYFVPDNQFSKAFFNKVVDMKKGEPGDFQSKELDVVVSFLREEGFSDGVYSTNKSGWERLYISTPVVGSGIQVQYYVFGNHSPEKLVLTRELLKSTARPDDMSLFFRYASKLVYEATGENMPELAKKSIVNGLEVNLMLGGYLLTTREVKGIYYFTIE